MAKLAFDRLSFFFSRFSMLRLRAALLIFFAFLICFLNFLTCAWRLAVSSTAFAVILAETAMAFCDRLATPRFRPTHNSERTVWEIAGLVVMLNAILADCPLDGQAFIGEFQGR